MQQICKIEDHDLPLIFICCNPTCTNCRILCFQCLGSLHINCNNYLLDLNLVSTRDFDKNRNWVTDKDIRTVAVMIEKKKFLGAADQVIASFQDNIDKEHDRLIAYFTQKLNEVRETTLNKFKNSYHQAQEKVELFSDQLKKLYNFNSLLEMINAWQLGDKEIKVISEELTSFFKGTSSNEQQIKSLKCLANELYSFGKDHLQLNTKSYQNFQISLEGLFASSNLIGKNAWSWDINKKSSALELCENNTKATNNIGNGFKTVLGNIEMSQGVYKWEIEVQSGRKDEFWVGFGVVEKSFIKDLEKFELQRAIGLASNGWINDQIMKIVKTLASYDNKTYLCHLDMDQGTFTISYQGTVVCEITVNIKGKVLLPCVILYHLENSAKLRVID